VPPDRRGNCFAKSNWLDGETLGRAERSRPESMVAISTATDIMQMISLMQTLWDRNFAWNFNNLLEDKRTIEFRKPPASTTSEQALGWAELAMSFIQASVVHGTLNRLQKIPPNTGGLWWFLEQGQVPGMNEPARWQNLFEGKSPEAALQPKAVGPDKQIIEMQIWEARAMVKTVEDQRRLVKLARTLRAPYW
jgi:hypothetical protein